MNQVLREHMPSWPKWARHNAEAPPVVDKWFEIFCLILGETASRRTGLDPLRKSTVGLGTERMRQVQTSQPLPGT